MDARGLRPRVRWIRGSSMAAMVALAYGWVGAQDWLIADLSSSRTRTSVEIEAQIGSICLYVADLVFPPAEGSRRRGSARDHGARRPTRAQARSREPALLLVCMTAG